MSKFARLYIACIIVVAVIDCSVAVAYQFLPHQWFFTEPMLRSIPDYLATALALHCVYFIVDWSRVTKYSLRHSLGIYLLELGTCISKAGSKLVGTKTNK